MKWRSGCAVALVAVAVLAGCSTAGARPGGRPVAEVWKEPASPSDSPSPAAASPSPSRVASPSPSRRPTPRPTATLKKTVSAGVDAGPAPASTSDGVPTSGAGTFTVASGGTGIVGTGTTLVKYRVEVEDGIAWGSNPVWTPDSFAAAVDAILANPRGWIQSGITPITDSAENMTNASWSFQRTSGTDYSVRIRLATPNTTDKLCGSVGLTTQGQYSCRYGTSEVINLRRWLRGVPGFGTDLNGYRNMVINHEMGHFLGFDHMLCPGSGQPAPVMQQQTIALNGCLPNPYPFTASGTFVIGPWAPS